MKSYEHQRKDRLQSVIDDYLQDETISSRQIFEEILSCINDVAEYHKKYLDRANDLKSFCVYKVHTPEENEYFAQKWQYDKIPNRY